MSFSVNEIFYSLQGEGMRAGEASTFVRFSGCNLRCNGSSDGEAYQPVCDTEFVSGMRYSVERLVAEASAFPGRWVVLTGGEPGLQVTQQLIDTLHAEGFKVAIETNGTQALPDGIDWVTVSPKTAEHTLVVKTCHEVKYIRNAGQGIPKTTLKADYYLISPAFDASGQLPRETLAWCIQLVKENPKWRLSVQQHKRWGVR